MQGCSVNKSGYRVVKSLFTNTIKKILLNRIKAADGATNTSVARERVPYSPSLNVTSTYQGVRHDYSLACICMDAEIASSRVRSEQYVKTAKKQAIYCTNGWIACLLIDVIRCWKFHFPAFSRFYTQEIKEPAY